MAADIQERVSAFFSTYPKRTIGKGETILHAEELPTGVFYIVEGRVSQYDITPNGNEVVVNAFRPGSFFPMSSAINKSENHYFFETSMPVVMYVAPAADAVQFLKDNPDIMFDLLSRVYSGVDGVLRRMAHLMGGDSRSRLLFELLNAANRFGDFRTDGTVFIALSEGDLAKHSGLARETINRIMQNLKATGLVSVQRSGITITDVHRIEDMLGDNL